MTHDPIADLERQLLAAYDRRERAALTAGDRGRGPARRLVALAASGLVVVVAAATVTAITLSSGSTAAPGAVAAAAVPAVHPVKGDPDKGDNPESPEQYLDLKETSDQTVSAAQIAQARAQAAALPTQAATDWSFIGPQNVGGRVVDLAVDPTTTPSTVFAAVSSGGIMKSSDGGKTWAPSWPTGYTQAMGSLARGSDGTLWAGTGEANPSGGGITFFGTGIYKSTDDGQTWQFSGLPNSAALGRIVVNPSNPQEIWAAAAGSISQVVSQRGIYHSTDGGQSWTQALAPPNSTTGGVDIALDPANPSIVWASLWDHYRNNGAHVYGGVGSGLYRSIDDGATWTRLDNSNIVPASPPVLGGPLCAWDQPVGGGATGKGVTTSGSPTLTAVTTTTGTFTIGDRIAGTGIPVGATITAIDNGTLTMSANATATHTSETITDTLPGTGLNADPSLGRIGIAVAPTDPNRVYIEFGSPFGPDKGFYYSNDGATTTGQPTFTCGGQAADPSGGGYEWVFGRLWVDPANENHLFDADINLRESVNGGITWQNNTNWSSAMLDPQGAFVLDTLHADQHAMAWDPQVPGRVYEGNDGGAYVSTTNGDQPNGSPPTTSISTMRNWLHGTVEPWTQSYHFAVSQTDSNRMVSGLQDNGSIRSWETGVEPTNLTIWNQYGSGDGHYVAINPANQLQYFECLQPSPPAESCERFTDAAATGSTSRATSSFSNPFPVGTRLTTDTPIVLDPADPNYVYIAGTSIARSASGVVSGTNAWTLISPTTPDSTASLPGPVPVNEIDGDAYYAGEYGSVTEIAPAKTTGTATTPASTIYAGTDTGLLWKTTNATATPATSVAWTQLGVGVLPTRWVNSIIVDPTNANHVYVAFSGYREGDNSANVWETNDGGATWTNISGDLPNAPVEKLTYDQPNDVLYAATDFGAFYLANHQSPATGWVNLSVGLPNAPVFDIELSGDHKTLFAATFGRGIWKLPLAQSVLSSLGASVASTLELTLGSTSPNLGTFTPAVGADYSTSFAASVTSTAGSGTLSVQDPSSVATGHLVNGAFALAEPLQAAATDPGSPNATYQAVAGSAAPTTLLTYAAPVSSDPVTIALKQTIDANEPLRTGGYSKTITFTLSTTTP